MIVVMTVANAAQWGCMVVCFQSLPHCPAPHCFVQLLKDLCTHVFLGGQIQKLFWTLECEKRTKGHQTKKYCLLVWTKENELWTQDQPRVLQHVREITQTATAVWFGSSAVWWRYTETQYWLPNLRHYDEALSGSCQPPSTTSSGTVWCGQNIHGICCWHWGKKRKTP